MASLIDSALYALMNGKKTITQPTFVKDFEKENQQLKDLIELSKKITSAKKELIDRDIALLKQGLEGEQNVAFELKNSFIPMLCLHDIRLEFIDYVAQMDFIVITHRFIYVLETKKLNGDVEITSDGDFVRIFKTNAGKIIKREGIYSPISQNERHINILREILLKEGLVKTFPIKSSVIIANPKSILNKTKCPKAIQNNIHKYDQLASLLKKELSKKTEDLPYLEKHMYNIARYLIENNKPISYDNMAKYSLTDEDFLVVTEGGSSAQSASKSEPLQMPVPAAPVQQQPITIENITETEVYKALKEYRLIKSREENVKAYIIYTNDEMEDIIRKNPKNKIELARVKGFGEKKIEKYGDSVLDILKANIK